VPYLLFLLLAFVSATASGLATEEEVASLGGDIYTPVGAERAGNAEGTIPAWQDGLAQVPPGDVSNLGLQDPFSGDKELFRITADNVGDYADKLSPGQVELLKRYPQSYY
jgi:hypothetical protein